MDRHSRREFLRKGAAAGVIVAGLPLVRTFDVPAFGQAGSPPVPGGGPQPGTRPIAEVAPEDAGAGDGGDGGGGAGTAVAGKQAAASSLPFTGGDPKNLAVAGAGAVALGTVMVGRQRRSGLGRATDPWTDRSLARLDKVFWGFESPPLHALGLNFRVRHTDAPTGPALLALLAPFRTGVAGDGVAGDGVAGEGVAGDGVALHDLSVRDRGVDRDPRFAIYRDGRVVATAGERWTALSALFGALDHAAVEQAALDRLVVHAAAIGLDDAVVMLVGPSGSGKTTLATALVRDGLGYVADEVVAVEPETLRVVPHHKPLVLKAGSHHVFPELRQAGIAAHGVPHGHCHWHVPATSIRPAPLLDGGVARCVIGVEHRAGAPSALEPMSEAEAYALVVQQCFNGDRLDEAALATAARLAREAACYRLHYSDTDTACALVRRALRAPSPGAAA